MKMTSWGRGLAALAIISWTLSAFAGGHRHKEPVEFGDFVVGAIGDSITQGVNATGMGAHPAYSWSAGTAIRSHFARLHDMYGDAVKAVNVSVSGARANALSDQVSSLIPYHPSYVTILLGANDACRWDPNQPQQIRRYLEQMHSGIQALVEHQPDVKIILAPIPNMKMLWQVGVVHNRCRMIWDTFNACPGLLNSDATDEDREAFQARVDDANDGLETIAHEFSANVKFDRDLTKIPFTWDDISHIDCFHPSAKGQEKLSRSTWDSGWFVRN